MEAPRSAQLETVDLEPQPIMPQDVKDYLHAAGEEELEQIRVELTPDKREVVVQVAMCPGRRSFPTRPSTITMSTNPDGSLSIEHSAIHIRVLDPLIHRD